MTAPTATKLPPTDTGRCGTYPGFQRHHRRGEQPCGPCREARNAYQFQWKAGLGPRRLSTEGAKPLPPFAHPYACRDVMHDFRPLSWTQCADCLGWRDDPRHPLVGGPVVGR